VELKKLVFVTGAGNMSSRFGGGDSWGVEEALAGAGWLPDMAFS